MNLKRRKKENLVTDNGTEQRTASREKQGGSSIITNAGQALGEETVINDELSNCSLPGSKLFYVNFFA